MDKYNDEIFNNNITNIAVIYRNYYSKQRESELIKIACACKKYRYKVKLERKTTNNLPPR